MVRGMASTTTLPHSLYTKNKALRLVTDMELRGQVARALTERCVMVIEYGNPDTRETSVREVEPLALSNIDGHWTFLAFCRSRKDLRSFRFDRVLDARVTTASFLPRRGLSLERFLHKQKRLTRLSHR